MCVCVNVTVYCINDRHQDDNNDVVFDSAWL